MVITISVFVAVMAVFVYAARKRAEINARGGCPVCNTPVPEYRRPTSFRQAFWGGWSCETCSAELDSNGMKVSQAAK
ncbi:MAG: hypothetical protein ABL984_05975 [Pyrinomonadaceae bacterium]